MAARFDEAGTYARSYARANVRIKTIANNQNRRAVATMALGLEHLDRPCHHVAIALIAALAAYMHVLDG